MKQVELSVGPIFQSKQSLESPNYDFKQSCHLKQLFEEELNDIYWTEKALTIAIPKMIQKATSQELIGVLICHLQETKTHVLRVEDIFASVQVTASTKKCEAIETLIREAEEKMEACDAGSMCDAGIISAAQKIEHYEIATYGTLRQFAKALGFAQAQQLLDTILMEEEAVKMKLSVIADSLNFEDSM